MSVGPRNAGLPDHRLPTALDVPKIDRVIVETPVRNVPCGVARRRSVPVVPPSAAITNAKIRGWGAWIRTREWRNQNPLPYHLATPQQVPIF
jgi:CO/xanthine dehydrogenase Mo-binding subunit